MQVDSTQAILDSPDGCHALRIRKLARRVTQLYDEALAPYGLTIGQMGILGTCGGRAASASQHSPTGLAAMLRRYRACSNRWRTPG
jgi:hypothetical protein